MANDKDKPNIVIACGAHHVPYHYRFLESALRDACYHVRIVQLPSTSPVVIEDTMDEDVQAIRQAVEQEVAGGKAVVLVLHSWSGFVGTAAIRGLEEPVRHVVYLAAWLQPSGKSSCEWLDVDEISIYDVKDGLNHVIHPRGKFYKDLAPQLADDSLQRLLPMVNSVTKQPLEFEPVWEKVDCTYVICEQDEAVPPRFAEMMMKGVNWKGKVVRMEGGHSPFLGRPGTLAGIVRRAAAEDEVELDEGVGED